jgi:hypothetical protein
MPISRGNTKVPYPNVSLTPVESCGNCEGCKAKCYALKAYRQYPNVRTAWDINLEHAKDGSLFVEIENYLCKHKPRFFRWHVAGDILDQVYLDHMCQLADVHPETKFLAFTKMYHLDYSRKPENLTIVFSAWPGQPMPETTMPISWVQDGTETRIPDNALECPGNCGSCGMCWSLPKLGRDVYFHIH